MTRFKIKVITSVTFILVSYFFANYMENVAVPTATTIWFAAASFFSGVFGIMSGIAAIISWEMGND